MALARKMITRHGVLKWYSQTKGYGFVTLRDPPEDALIHKSCLNGWDVSLLSRGALIDCEVVPNGDKGLNVTKINGVSAGDPAQLEKEPEGEWEPAVVKWFNKERGYGFCSRGEGTKDIFIHATTRVFRDGNDKINFFPSQKIYVIIIEGPNGLLKAVAVRPA